MSVYKDDEKESMLEALHELDEREIGLVFDEVFETATKVEMLLDFVEGGGDIREHLKKHAGIEI